VNLEPLHDVPDLSERAYRAIKDAILTLKYRPGEILTTGNLAEQLNISRTPVREALLRLQLDGLVTLLPQKGAEVSGINAEDITDILELRIVLESYAIKVATSRLTDEELHNLELVMQEAKEAFQRKERSLASDTARELHNVMINKVNNRRMRVLLDALEDHYRRIRFFSALIPGRLQKSFEQHTAILEALQARDACKAEQAMIEHLISVKEDILASIENWDNILDTVVNSR
jgi:DNA-binding GntR family transcriptional regulator